MLIYNNEAWVDYDWPPYSSNVFYFSGNKEILINNATVTGNFLNQGIQGGPIFISDRNITVNIYNSIFYNNSPNNLMFNYSHAGTSPAIPSHLYVNNTLLPGGQSAVPGQGEYAILHWGEGNIDANPLFNNDDDEFPYQLSEDSPAIDAGTLDIPDYTFLETDIMGNPRVVGRSVDLGAYEFQGIIANFTAEPVTGNVPLTVQFTDQTSGVVFAWQWDFDLDGHFDSTEQNPSYTYTLPGTYSVRLVINYGEKQIIRENLINVSSVGGTDEVILPLISNISEPYPNPFRGRTMFKATINEDGKISMIVYNIKGQRVRTLVNDQRPVGIYQIVWDGKDEKGKPVASGVYSIEMRHNNQKIGVTKVSYVR
jgi:PKD repeat protein